MRRTLTTLALMILMVGGLAAPAGAVDLGESPVGDRISLYGPGAVTAEQPFHVKHGWQEEIGVPFPWLRAGFRLYVDGSHHPLDGLQVIESGGVLDVFRVHNFESGLSAGSHTFLGRWTLPCQFAVDNGYISTDCGSSWWQRQRPVVVDERTVTVDVTG